jgi:predicted dehydrogenase
MYITEPSLTAGSAAFFEGDAGGKPEDVEARMWIDHVRDDAKPLVVTPEQALIVTKILEAIYESGKTGQPVFFK